MDSNAASGYSRTAHAARGHRDGDSDPPHDYLQGEVVEESKTETQGLLAVKGIVVRFTDRDYRDISQQAKRVRVSVEDFINVSANWKANEVRKDPKPVRMPPVLYGD